MNCSDKCELQYINPGSYCKCMNSNNCHICLINYINLFKFKAHILFNLINKLPSVA